MAQQAGPIDFETDRDSRTTRRRKHVRWAPRAEHAFAWASDTLFRRGWQDGAAPALRLCETIASTAELCASIAADDRLRLALFDAALSAGRPDVAGRLLLAEDLRRARRRRELARLGHIDIDDYAPAPVCDPARCGG